VLVLVLFVLLQVPEVGVLQHGPWFGIKEDVKIKVKFIIQEKTETEVFKLSLIVKFLGSLVFSFTIILNQQFQGILNQENLFLLSIQYELKSFPKVRVS